MSNVRMVPVVRETEKQRIRRQNLYRCIAEDIQEGILNVPGGEELSRYLHTVSIWLNPQIDANIPNIVFSYFSRSPNTPTALWALPVDWDSTTGEHILVGGQRLMFVPATIALSTAVGFHTPLQIALRRTGFAETNTTLVAYVAGGNMLNFTAGNVTNTRFTITKII